MKQPNKKPAQQQTWITFNVGGIHFSTTRSTLIKGTPPNSPLHRVCVGSTNIEWDRDEKGAYLIDRDPTFFQALLNFLRYGRLILCRYVPEEGVLLEAEYFNVPELAKEIRQKITARQQKNHHNHHHHHNNHHTRFVQTLPPQVTVPKIPHYYHQNAEIF